MPHLHVSSSKIRQPIIAVAHEPPAGASRQIVVGWLAFMQVGGSQIQMGDDSGPDYASMHAKTRESLSDRMIFAKTGLAFKARAAGSTRKLVQLRGNTAGA